MKGMKRKAYDIHPDFMKLRHIGFPMQPWFFLIINRFLTRWFDQAPLPVGLTESRLEISGYRDAPIRLQVFRPVGHDEALPTMVYCHGGGFALQAVPVHKRLLCAYALGTPCQVVFVDYRLLPAATFPIGLEDCFAAYQWVGAHTDELRADPDRIAIGGDSAGGSLTIGVCLLARERNLNMPCFQLLVYPGCDARNNTPSMREFTDVPLWNSKKHAKITRLYYRDGMHMKREIISPVEADSLAGLPPAYVEVAEFDCLRDEGIAYVRTLRRDGVAAELNQTRRTIHGFELAEGNEIVKQSVARRIRALQTAFAANHSSDAG